MGAHCTKVKRDLVIQPIRAAAEDPTQPESLSADGRKRLEIDHKKSSKVRKDSDVSINAGCPPYQPSGNYIGSTDDCLEDTLKPYAIHYITHPAHEDVSQFFGDALTKKSAYYQKGPLIGTGPSGEVYECLNLNTGELVAVKEIKLHGESQRIQPYLEAIRKENTLFKTLCHPNIMRYYDIEISEVKSQNQFTVGLAVEYVSGGSIKALLDKFHSLDEKVVMSYTRQILEGLSYLHKMGIVHKNLKGSNILIDANGTIKLADFGSFKFDSFCEESQLGPSNLCASVQNSIYWLAPEVVMKKGQGKAADIWSVGCLAIEMLTGLPPWKSLERSFDETTKLISSGSPPPFPQDISENCRDFLYKVLKFKPEDRPNVADLLAHPFVKHISPNNSLLESDTFQSSLLYGRPTEIFRSNSSTNFKANDSRLQVLATNLTTSNVYPSRVMNLMVNGVMKNYATDLVPLSNSDIQDSEGNPSMRPSLRKVQEVSYEDEYTPSITQKQFFPKSSKLASALVAVEKELTQEELEKIKAERRRQIEEEMMRELNHTSIDQTKEFHEKELENSQENIQLEDEQADFGMDHLKVVPMQNAFFGQSPSKDFKGIDTSRSKDVENSHIENGGETSKNMEDEIERRFAEIRPNTETNFWAWSEEQDKVNNFSTKENIRASANNFEELQNKEPEEQVLRPRMINRPIRPNMNKTNRSNNKQQIDNAKEELVSDDMTNIVDVSDFEGGIHKRDLPVRVESAKLKGDSLSNANSNEEREVLQSRDETEENKEESLEYAKQDLNTLVVN